MLEKSLSYDPNVAETTPQCAPLDDDESSLDGFDELSEEDIQDDNTNANSLEAIAPKFPVDFQEDVEDGLLPLNYLKLEIRVF